jgi:hypothetical protein
LGQAETQQLRAEFEASTQLVSVQVQPGVPVLLTPTKCVRRDDHVADVEYNVVNTSEKVVKSFTVSARLDYTDYTPGPGDKMSVKTEYPEDRWLPPGWSHHSRMGGGTITKSGGIPIGPLTRFTLYVENVTFLDGSEWTISH